MRKRYSSLSWTSFRKLLVIGYAFFLPFCEWFTVRLSNILMIALCGLAIIEFVRSPKLIRVLIRPVILLGGGIFLVQLVDLFHLDNTSVIGKNLLLKLPFLLFPLALFHLKIDRAMQLRIESAFITGCLLACLLTFRFVFNTAYQEINLLNYATYEKFLVLQRPYFGMYLLLSICFLYQQIQTNRSLMKWILIIILILFIWLIQAKMALLTLTILGVLESRNIAHPSFRKWVPELVLSAILSLLFFLSLFYFHHYKNPNKLSGNKRFFVLSVNTRLDHTTCAFEIIRQNPLLGVGTGQLTERLDRCYEEKKFDFIRQGMHYNVHNEWLEEMARHGMIGLGVYLIVFFFLVRHARQSENPASLQFLIIVILLACTETLFSRAQGVLMIAFFNTLFMLPKLQKGSPISK